MIIFAQPPAQAALAAGRQGQSRPLLLSGFLGAVLSVITLVEAATRESLPGSRVCRK